MEGTRVQHHIPCLWVLVERVFQPLLMIKMDACMLYFAPRAFESLHAILGASICRCFLFFYSLLQVIE